MYSYNRLYNTYRNTLLEYKVKLKPDQWYCFDTLNQRNRFGKDLGNEVFLSTEIHQKIIENKNFTQYSLKRMRNDGVEEYWRRPIYYCLIEKKCYLNYDGSPASREEFLDELVLHKDYDMYISFNTNQEAILFKLMFF